MEFLNWLFSDFEGRVNGIILGLLALSTLFFIAEVLGFLPKRLARWLNRNRLDQTILILEEFGVDVGTSRRVNSVARLEHVTGKNLEKRVGKRLKLARINHQVTVGTQVVVPADHYIDLMGTTTDPNAARIFARDLSAHWRRLAGPGGPVANHAIDFIVTPKTGSPLLGSAFAELLGKPLLLHNPVAKFGSAPEDPKAFFDCRELPAAAARGLIVDDSSTGGGKALRLIEDLRRCGWTVSDFLVVFEPQLKVQDQQNAAERLRPQGVALHSIVRT